MFFSLPHIIYMLTPVVLLIVIYMLFRNAPAAVKRLAVFLLALLNTLQHLLKIYIYPQYAGESFGGRSTAYNMCALLILISPIILLIGSQLWQNFLFYIGSIAGIASLCVTYWLKEPVEEQLRFVICHGLLFLTSFLPYLFGIYKINYRKCWKIPFVFVGCLTVLIVNNMVTFNLGLVGDTGNLTMWEFLVRENPCWAMCPPKNYPFVEELMSPLIPSPFLASKGGVDTPILWYFFPIVILMTVIGFLLGCVFDGKGVLRDLKAPFKPRRKKSNNKK